MRDDMDKIITERVRHGAGRTRRDPARGSKDYDNLPHYESTRRHHNVNHTAKEFSDNLAPLKRYFDKQVGRPWSKVYAEIAQGIDTRKTTSAHILQHVDQFVASNCVPCELTESVTGYVYHSEHYGRWAVGENQIMVDPSDGILKRAKRRVPRKTFKVDSPTRFLTDKRAAVKHKGIWYDVEIATYEIKKVVQPHVFTAKEIKWAEENPALDLLKPRNETVTLIYSGGEIISSVKDCNIGLMNPNSYQKTSYRYKNDTERMFDIYRRRNVYGKSRKTMNANDLRKFNLVND